MGLSKNNQVKFRIDDHTKMALERLLKNKNHITIYNGNFINRISCKKYRFSYR